MSLVVRDFQLKSELPYLIILLFDGVSQIADGFFLFEGIQWKEIPFYFAKLIFQQFVFLP